jgi:hypothetical protein
MVNNESDGEPVTERSRKNTSLKGKRTSKEKARTLKVQRIHI